MKYNDYSLEFAALDLLAFDFTTKEFSQQAECSVVEARRFLNNLLKLGFASKKGRNWTLLKRDHEVWESLNFALIMMQDANHEFNCDHCQEHGGASYIVLGFINEHRKCLKATANHKA